MDVGKTWIFFQFYILIALLYLKDKFFISHHYAGKSSVLLLEMKKKKEWNMINIKALYVKTDGKWQI